MEDFLKYTAEYCKNMVIKLNPIIKSFKIELPKIQETLNNFLLFHSQNKKFIKKLNKWNLIFCPYLNDFPFDYFSIYSDKKQTIKLLENTFADNNFYHFNKLFDKYKNLEIYKMNYKIIFQCQKAYKMKLYFPVVSTLFPIIENSLLSLPQLQKTPKDSIKECLNDKTKKKEKLERNQNNKKNFKDLISPIDLLEEHIFEDFINKIFEINYEKSFLKRNEILHGRDKKFGTKINALMMFFTLNFIFEIYYENNKNSQPKIQQKEE